MVKRLPAMWETWVRFLGQEDPLEKEMATYYSILAWKIQWTEELGGLQSMGSQESDMTLVTKPPPQLSITLRLESWKPFQTPLQLRFWMRLGVLQTTTSPWTLQTLFSLCICSTPLTLVCSAPATPLPCFSLNAPETLKLQIFALAVSSAWNALSKYPHGLLPQSIRSLSNVSSHWNHLQSLFLKWQLTSPYPSNSFQFYISSLTSINIYHTIYFK